MMDTMTTRGCEAMEEDTQEETIVNKVFQMLTTSNRTVRNYGRRKLPEVPVDHLGPVPNVPVGTCWKYRWQVSEAGVHRPTVAGIHGRESRGAFSIVLSGVYEDDKDFGDYFLYSGCGGKESDKSKRVSPQVYDQQLTRHNRSLALCCNAPINETIGASATRENWQDGKPVRVVRKHSKFSNFAPKEGFRYDGIYKVYKYYPVLNGKTGLLVWTFELMRDDETPAPWTTEGMKKIQELNLKIMIPTLQETENHICSQEGNKRLLSQEGNKILLKKKAKRAVLPSKKLRREKKRSLTDRYDFRLRIRQEDEDIKPNLRELAAYASGADIPWALPPPQQYSLKDVKPTLNELTAAKMDYQSSTIDIDEDVKPDIKHLNLMMGIESFDSPVKSEPTDLSTVKSEPTDLPVIRSTTSLATSTNSEDVIANSTPLFKISVSSQPASNLLEISPRKSEPSWNIPEALLGLIDRDEFNKHTWTYLKSPHYRTKEDFLNRVKIMFSCPACSNIVKEPITTTCQHNICLSCLKENFEKQIRICPYCHTLLPDIIRKFSSNLYLTDILNFLFS